MASFDLDDPLGDLLSDGSDDSFFNEPKPAVKRASISRSPEKKSVKDLFGLEDKPSDSKEDWLGSNVKKNEPEPKLVTRRTDKPTKKISFEDDDILSNLGLDSNTKTETVAKVSQTKKASLIESILGPPKEEDKKFFSLDDLLKNSKLKKNEVPEISQSTSQLPEKSETTAYGLSSLDAPREGRRGRSKTTTLPDPLGLFNTEPENKPKRTDIPPPQEIAEPQTEILMHPKEIKTKSVSSISDAPEWLGGASNTKIQIPTDKTIDKSGSRRNSVVESKFEEPIMQNMSYDSLLTQQKISASNIEYQNTSLALQQQESQLIMALQLRKYEENLANMQRKQSDVLIKQEQQFNSLLDQQFTKQQIMENNMRLQQERINNHIQMLISQPTISTSSKQAEAIDEAQKAAVEESTKQFEDIIGTLKQRQHEEMFLLEESYKKQMSTIEQSMESVENHLKMELDATSHKYKEKIEQLETEHTNEIEKYKKKVEELHARHENEMKQMRENNNRVLEEIKYEYNTIIENIKVSKQNEQNILQNTNSYSEKLEENLKLLHYNSQSLMDIREKVEKECGVFSMVREESIKAKEEEIKLMRATLEKSREATDTERAELMGLVRNLEIKLAEQSHNSREERFALQQAASTFSARAAAIEREAEFNRNSLEREREQLKILRENLLAEQEKSMQIITEEKLALHAEKVRIETSMKLVQNYDTQRAKAEMEAAVQVAKEATELTDRERENLLRQLREVETLKRNLTDRERKLLSREKDIEIALDQANRKSAMGEKALEEARITQVNYNERLREIQSQMASLAMRERKLAEEKIAISRERLALHNATRTIRKCGLCAVDNVSKVDVEVDDNNSVVEQDIPRIVSDADMFRLQLQMSEDHLNSYRTEEV